MNKHPKRKNARLSDFDYSSDGVYFVTICTKDKTKIFWQNNTQKEYPECLSQYGKIAYNAIEKIPLIYSFSELVAFVVMPNHMHLLIKIEAEQVDKSGRMISAPTKSLATIVGQLKRAISIEIGHPVWQKSYYDHIVRDENDLLTKWKYISENPLRWNLDEYF